MVVWSLLVIALWVRAEAIDEIHADAPLKHPHVPAVARRRVRLQTDPAAIEIILS